MSKRQLWLEDQPPKPPKPSKPRVSSWLENVRNPANEIPLPGPAQPVTLGMDMATGPDMTQQARRVVCPLIRSDGSREMVTRECAGRDRRGNWLPVLIGGELIVYLGGQPSIVIGRTLSELLVPETVPTPNVTVNVPVQDGAALRELMHTGGILSPEASDEFICALMLAPSRHNAFLTPADLGLVDRSVRGDAPPAPQYMPCIYRAATGRETTIQRRVERIETYTDEARGNTIRCEVPALHPGEELRYRGFSDNPQAVVYERPFGSEHRRVTQPCVVCSGLGTDILNNCRCEVCGGTGVRT